MVIGNGMIAKKFQSYKNNDSFLIFASGVSNSSTTNPDEYLREENLLKDIIENHKDTMFVYFSSCCLYDESMRYSTYYKHKIKLENLIRQNHNHYTIFRISNPVGITGNAHTVVNFFVQHISKKIPFNVWKHATRNVLDIDDMFALCDFILKNKLFITDYVNIANPENYPILKIVKMIEAHCNISGNYDVVEKGSNPEIDTSGLNDLYKELQINFDKNYFTGILKKYFSV